MPRYRVAQQHALAPGGEVVGVAGRAAPDDVVGDRLLGESCCRLVIPSYDAATGDVHVFKTAHNPRVLEDYKQRAADVARATSAAPTYLPMFVILWGQQFLDGGVWANCPATVAILGATGVLGVVFKDIQLLSIGTPTFSVEKSGAGGDIVQYGFGVTVVELLMQAQAAGAWA